MPRFFITAAQVEGDRVRIDGADAHHLAAALRARPGEVIVTVQDGVVERGVRLHEVSRTRVVGRVLWSRPAGGEPELRVHAVVALAAQGMDTALQALTAAGAATLRPVRCQRSVARPDHDSAERRLARWRTIAREAAGLAGRAHPPLVHPVASLPDALRDLPAPWPILACVADPHASPIRSAPGAGTDIAIVIGPEGGLSESERQLLRDRGAGEVHLGPRVLPHWLAGAVAVTLLLAGSGDLDTALRAEPLHG